ncbi:hypothetical protein Rmet_6437 [Cupriavidus metallidurans CH34]|uniref:Uncharacterized protein n=1 Tax=Cupriavidus metallidurans (strain ATCC 43123 / DSM 2839 / NBRC 102507 / CH34) TaxID=266264 RepID=D3DXN4_CUPMC|nr:hypothetical protein Rmet_6437 [Cupriavidus metallidurans CH34]
MCCAARLDGYLPRLGDGRMAPDCTETRVIMRNKSNLQILTVHKQGKRGYNRPLASTVDHCTVGTRESHKFAVQER